MSKKKTTAPGGATASRREQLRLQQEAEARHSRMLRIITVGAIVLAIAVAAIVGTVAWQKHSKKQAAITAAGTPTNAKSDNTAIIANPGKAKQGAPVVAIYSDYQCPVCKQFEQQLGDRIDGLAAKGEIQLENHTMTFMEVNLANSASTRSAVAAACSDKFGVYSKFHREIFNNQAEQEIRGSEGYSDELLRQTIPTKLGLAGQQLTDFQSCYDTKATEGFIKAVDEAAGKAGVTSTPTVMVNGKKVETTEFASATDEAALLKIIQSKA